MIAPERDAVQVVIGTASGGSGQTTATATLVEVGPMGLVSIQVVVDSGVNGAAPTDSPLGTLRLYASSSRNSRTPALLDMPLSPLASADSDLAAVSPTGNNALLNGWANLQCTPGVLIAVVYGYTSGGGAGSRLRVGVVTS